jgi:FKBP-type peptidyl-prolyl cis-trans isomerase
MCVTQMCRGQSVKVVINPKHAYGTAGCPPVSLSKCFTLE